MTYEKFNEDDDSPEQFTIVWGDNPTQIEVRTPALEERSYKEWLGRFFSRVYEGLPVEGNLKLPEDSNEYVTLGGHKSITPNDDDFDAISSAQFTSGGANMMALFRGVMKKSQVSGDCELTQPHLRYDFLLELLQFQVSKCSPKEF